MDSVIVTQPMQWGSAPDIADVEPLSARDKECLREVRDVLSRYGNLNRFGLSLIHKHFDIDEGECLVETIDVENRVLTVRPVPKNTVGHAIETQWRLSDGAAIFICDQQCVYNSGHTSRHYNRPGIGEA